MSNNGQQAQHQSIPGTESEMNPKPVSINPNYKAAGRLEGRTAIISGGDSGIGKAVAIAFAKEGADCAIIYLSEDSDALETKKMVEEENRKCLLIKGDVGNKSFCLSAGREVKENLGQISILINNAGEQHVQQDIEKISEEQLRRTFQTNIFGMFFMTQAVLEELTEGSSIINTASVTAFQGREQLIDYSSTKGAIVSFTRSLAQNLAKKKIRVNAIAPGPIWTPLIPSTFPADKVEKFGTDTPLGRAGQPYEVAAGFVFLASDDASYITGQTLHINGGEPVSS